MRGRWEAPCLGPVRSYRSPGGLFLGIGLKAGNDSSAEPILPRFSPLLPMAKHPPATTFPEVTGTSLDGVEYTLPADFRAPWNLLVITFHDDLDRLSDKWVLLAERIAEGSGGRLDAYELPLVGKGFRAFKSIVNASIEMKNEADAAEKARTIPLYLDRDKFRKELGLKNRDTVHVLLVSRDGHIAWRSEGAMTPDTIAGLERIVEEQLGERDAEAGPPAG